MTEDFFNDKLVDQALIVKPNEGEKFEMNGVKLTFKVASENSKDQLGVYEIILTPGAIGAKLHYHRFMDETFIVQEGTLTIQVSDQEYQSKAGTVAYIPRFTPHGFRNDTDKEVTLTLIFNPSQKREGFFRGLKETLSEDPVDQEKFLKLYHKYDSFPIDTLDMIPIRDQNLNKKNQDLNFKPEYSG